MRQMNLRRSAGFVKAARRIAVAVFAFGLATPLHAGDASYPHVTLDWYSSASGQEASYIMHQHSHGAWWDNDGLTYAGGDSGSAWDMDWVVTASAASGAATSTDSHFVNASIAVTNLTDSYQTFSTLVTMSLPEPFTNGTLMNGSVSASVQDAFGDGAEIRSVDDQPIYQAFIDGSFTGSGLLNPQFNLVAPPGGTQSTSETFGMGNPLLGSPAINSISVMLSFELSPFDTANVVGTFQIAHATVPAPAGLPLLVGFMLGFRSRRRDK